MSATVEQARRCKWCGDDIPATMRKGSQYCGRKCSRDAHHAKTRGKRPAKATAGMFLPSALDLRLRDRERLIIAEARARRSEAA